MIFPAPMRSECAVSASSGVMVPERNLKLLVQTSWWIPLPISPVRSSRWSMGRNPQARAATSEQAAISAPDAVDGFHRHVGAIEVVAAGATTIWRRAACTRSRRSRLTSRSAVFQLHGIDATGKVGDLRHLIGIGCALAFFEPPRHAWSALRPGASSQHRSLRTPRRRAQYVSMPPGLKVSIRLRQAVNIDAVSGRGERPEAVTRANMRFVAT